MPPGKDLRYFIFENQYKLIGLGFTEEECNFLKKGKQKKALIIFPTKLTERIPDPSKSKEYHESFFLKKKTGKKNDKQSKAVKKSNNGVTKCITITFLKIASKLSKAYKTFKIIT